MSEQPNALAGCNRRGILSVQHSPSRKQLWCIWLLLGSLAAAVCSLIWPAAHLGNEYLPVGNDSFYHARRILDTAADPAGFYEFDPKIHAPEGSLLTWPWGYDYAMGWLVRGGIKSGLSQDPMAILVWIPTLAVFISMGLIMLICRRLSLSIWSTVLAGLCVAFLPLTQYLHGVGFIDHHYAEYIFVLATVAVGLQWFNNPPERKTAAVLGSLLGIAPAINNGLFVLQIPILLSMLFLWLQRIDVDCRATTAFGISLIASTIAVLVPSLPFRQGMFDYYLLSWFHLYVACGTAVSAAYFSRVSNSPRSMLIFAGSAVLMVMPLAYQISMARAFLVGDITRLDSIAEMKSVLELSSMYGMPYISNRYSLLVWLFPLTFCFCLYKLHEERRSGRVFFWVCTVCGLTLFSMQFRMHYFGSFALFIPWLVLVDRLAQRKEWLRLHIMLGASLLWLIFYIPPIRNQLLGPMLPANDPYFAKLKPLLDSLQQACLKEPGTVLADNDAGHYIRFYTNCSVIVNNFLLTRQHEDKIQEFEHWMSLSPDELAQAAPFIRYVLMRPADIVIGTENNFTYISYTPGTNRLTTDLLLRPLGESSKFLPPSFELLNAVSLSAEYDIPYARLYKIRSDLTPEPSPPRVTR